MYSSASPRSRRSSVAAAAAAALVAVPLIAPTVAAGPLEGPLPARAEYRATTLSAASSALPTGVLGGHLGTSDSAVLRSLDVHALSQLVSLPHMADALVAAAADPTPGQQIFTALVDSLGKIAKGLVRSPINILQSVGHLLQGNVELAVVDLVTIISDPILSIGTENIPAILSALGQKFPKYADGLNSLDFPIQLAGLSVLGVFLGTTGLSGSLQNIVTGISTGLVDGNVFTAAKNALTATGALFTNLYKNVLGPDFSVRTQVASLVQAIAAVFKPAAAPQISTAVVGAADSTRTVLSSSSLDESSGAASVPTAGTVKLTDSVPASTATPTPTEATDSASETPAAAEGSEDSGTSAPSVVATQTPGSGAASSTAAETSSQDVSKASTSSAASTESSGTASDAGASDAEAGNGKSRVRAGRAASEKASRHAVETGNAAGAAGASESGANH